MRSAQAVMADLAATGLSPEQIALVMELSATVAAEARPVEDRAATRRRERDRTYQAERRQNRQISADSPDAPLAPLNGFPGPLPNNPPLSPVSPIASAMAPTPELKPEQVIEAWNVMADGSGLPKAKMTPERAKKLRPFIRRHSVDDITEAIWTIPRTPFLCGENDRGWKASIDFLLQPSSFTKISEGTYGG